MANVDLIQTNVGEYSEFRKGSVPLEIYNYFLHRFSHGENVLYSAIKEYNEPDFKLLNRNRCPVLAKKSDNVWYRGRVKFANFDDKTCKVTLEHAKEEISCDFVDVFPLCDGKRLNNRL